MSARRIALLTAAVATTGGAALAQSPDPEPAQPDRGRGEPVAAVEPDQARSYGVLRRAIVAEDRMPARAADAVSTMMGDVGAAPDLARRARLTRSGTTIHVVPARGHVCLQAGDATTREGSGTCNRTAEALRGFLLAVDWPAPGITRLYGLVPDGTAQVRLRARDGTVEHVAPEGNVYVFETPLEPAQIAWGDVVIPIPERLGD